MINAKTENLTKSKAYGPLVGKFRHRCLIVADGFYEWMKAEDPKQPRQPWRFTVDDGAPFAFAGLCTRKPWEDDDRGLDADGYLYSATIITTTPNEVVKPVHNRMPAILPGPEAEAAWLRPDLSAEDAIAMLGPLDARRMEGAPANPALNKVGGASEGSELLVAPQTELRRPLRRLLRLPPNLLRRGVPVPLLRLLRRSAAAGASVRPSFRPLISQRRW
jgi:putative SOS response-associated peptidase YedK